MPNKIARGLHHQFLLRVRKWKRELRGRAVFRMRSGYTWLVELGHFGYSSYLQTTGWITAKRVELTFYGRGRLATGLEESLNVHVVVRGEYQRQVGNFWLTDMAALMEHGDRLIHSLRFIGRPLSKFTENDTTEPFLLSYVGDRWEQGPMPKAGQVPPPTPPAYEPPRIVIPNLPAEKASAYINDIGSAVFIEGHPYKILAVEPNDHGSYTLEASKLALLVGGHFDGEVMDPKPEARLFFDLPDDYHACYCRTAECRYEYDCLFTSEEYDELLAQKKETSG